MHELSAKATDELGDWGGQFADDDTDDGAAKWLFDMVKAKRFDYETDNQSVDWDGIVLQDRAAAEELRALEFTSDADIAQFIIDYITGS